jgi:NADH-quinone oxidoreductase subunit A
MIEYAAIGIFFLFAALIAGIFLGLTTVLGPKKRTPVKSEPFECGEDSIQLPQGRRPVKFYVLGMLFILFDIELIFLFPWAVLCRELGWLGWAQMALFLFVLMTGYVYAWKKGALDLK